MRLLKAVIFGSIIGLLAYYIFRKRDSGQRRPVPNPTPYGHRVDEDGLDAADMSTCAGDGELDSLETEAVSPEPIAVHASSEALTLSHKPHTPSLFENTVQTWHSVSAPMEDIPVDDGESASGDGNPVVGTFDIEGKLEPTQHPGRRVETGEYYPSARNTLPKARLRCRDNGGEWTLYLEIPNEREVAEIRHGGAHLVQGKEIEVQHFTGEIVVNYKDGGHDEIGLCGSTPLYFRTDDDWEQDGRLVTNPVNGYFIVIAPTDMDDEFAESEHDPEDCTDPGFHAHFLAIGEEYDSETYGKYPATLVGTKIYDAADKDFHGELYVGQPPDLSVHEMVTNARIVEETGSTGENRWGVNFDPHIQKVESVLDGRDGRFTVRTYLKDSHVRHESKTFRFFKSLEYLELDGQTYSSDNILTPENDGKYGVSLLKFNGRDGIVKPVKVDSHMAFVSEDGLVKIPPNPSIKSVSCEFSNRAVIVVDIPRVWWRLVGGAPTNKWNDIPKLTREDFIRIARKNAYIEMMLPRSVDTMRVGFGSMLDHRVPIAQDAAKIELRDFVDHVALENMRPEGTRHLIALIDNVELRLLSVFLEPCERHHWVLDEPSYNSIYPTGYSKGVCKVCGTVDRFSNVSDMVKEQRLERRTKGSLRPRHNRRRH